MDAVGGGSIHCNMTIVQAHSLQRAIKGKTVTHSGTITIRRYDSEYQTGGGKRLGQGLQARGMHTIIIGH